MFGLGDSGYLQYNAFAKQVDNHLERLQASRHCELTLGDASKNIEAIFRSWEVTICNKLGFKLSPKTGLAFQEVSIIQQSAKEVEEKGGAFTGEPERLRSYKYNAP